MQPTLRAAPPRRAASISQIQPSGAKRITGAPGEILRHDLFKQGAAKPLARLAPRLLGHCALPSEI
jgi:hypothetical protein